MVDEEILQAIEQLCDRLSERRVSAFLGAGINHGLVNEAGVSCPLGQNLSDMIAVDLLYMDKGGRPLDSVAEMARYSVGSSNVNSYLYNLLKGYSPGQQHLSLVQLPWNVIYTTNYDTIVEQAAENVAISPAGKIQRVVSVHDSTDDFAEEDIPYFKLHGCIELANTERGRLILTKEDYRFYEEHRKPLFRRLREDLLHQTLVFIGYGLEDDNFRAILEDCRNQLNSDTFPPSFAVRPNANQQEKAFWKEKYNITTLNTDAQTFLNLLKGTWNAQRCTVVPFNLRHTNEYTKFDDNTSFQKIGESFYLVKSEDCTPASNPKALFSGKEPGWGDIRDRIPPYRDAFLAILDAMIEELVETSEKGNVYLITGAAGTGKTTLIRTLAYELVESSYPVVMHIPGTPLNDSSLRPLLSSDNPKRVVVMIEHAAERMSELERFISDVQRKKLPITIVLSERKNLWEFSILRGRHINNCAEYELGRLSHGEISRILSSLERHGELGKLTGMSEQYQLEHFEQVAGKELLVALRELTESGSFDDIIRDEYQKIPSEIAKKAYLYVSALGQIDLPVRLEVLARLLGIGVEEIGRQVIAATEGILLTGEDFGSSRHNSGFRVQSRHPIIASVIFDFAAHDDQGKYDVINSLITHLNCSFPEDYRVLRNIVRSKDLVNTIASKSLRRDIYERLAIVLPGDPYVLQHRSLLEREMGDADSAIRFARAAIEKQPNNPAFMNTLGFSYEAKARTAEPLERDGLLRQATKIFEDGISRDAADSFSYAGLYSILRQKEFNERDPEKRLSIRLRTLSMLEEAYEATNQSSIISGYLAKTKENLGEPAEAIVFLKSELLRQPQDGRMRDMLVRMLHSSGNVSDALQIAEDGVKYNPAAWRLQRHIARLQRRLDKSPESIEGHYEAALRHNKGDCGLIAEYGSYLFMVGKYSESEVVFNQGRQLHGTEKRVVKEVWKGSDGSDKMFTGIVQSIVGASGYALAVPENFTVLFWRTREPLTSLKQRDGIVFSVGFTACGAVTRSLRKR